MQFFIKKLFEWSLNDKNSLKKMHCKKKHNQIIGNSKSCCSTNIHEINLYQGFYFLEIGNPQKALECLNHVDTEFNQEITGKIKRYIGLAHYLMEHYEAAQEAFELGEKENDRECILWDRLLFPQLYNFHETTKIIFRFVDFCSKTNEKLFILKSLSAYTRICGFIGKPCLYKINIYIYANRKDSIGNNLSYSDNGLKAIHMCIHDIVGHEIAHILFNSIHTNMCRNRFIDEGIATFFNEDTNFDSFLEKYVNKMMSANVYDLWNNPNMLTKHSDSMACYYFAGAFVGYLLKVYGKEKFLEFISDETIENAYKIFGLSLDENIRLFHQCVNSYMH